MELIKINKKQYRDKVYACWIGKNIGGTVGGPYEGKTEILDVTGFASPKGEPLPNDDLDLQLVWLDALRTVGPRAFNSNVLADYWVGHIPPHWNEYGIGKSNLKMGILPPMSGEFHNEGWKHSNGAWIRSEIWACLNPGYPYMAIRYAIIDASVDHGYAEGTIAEIFTAAMECLAFFENDIRKIIEKALGYIPQQSMVAKSIKLVLDEYDKKTPWQEVREKVVELNKDLGWFQAPGNLAFAVLGLMYGEGDFKKSIIYAVNCGDDTDCTGATVGAFLGILGGTAAIPEDWREYIGDKIICIAADRSTNRNLAKTCTELTDSVVDLMPQVMYDNTIIVEYTDGDNEYIKDFDKFWMEMVTDWKLDEFFSRKQYSFEITTTHTRAIVEYDTEPFVTANQDFNISITLINRKADPRHISVDVCLPEGWTADYPHSTYLSQLNRNYDGKGVWKMTLHVGEKVLPANRFAIIFSSEKHPEPLVVPITLLG